jgi:type III secretory pathway component EscV
METISFALGVASVLVVLLGTVTVWVTFRVKNLIKENSDLNITINNLYQNIDRRFENLEHHYSDEIKEIHDTINVRTDGVYIRIKEETVSLERHMDHMLETSKKYTDSRIDKLVDAYFEQKEILSKTKQIIKG